MLVELLKEFVMIISCEFEAQFARLISGMKTFTILQNVNIINIKHCNMNKLIIGQ